MQHDGVLPESASDPPAAMRRRLSHRDFGRPRSDGPARQGYVMGPEGQRETRDRAGAARPHERSGLG